MKNNIVAIIVLIASLLVGSCKKEDDSSIQLAGTTWCAQLSDDKHDYQYQLAFLNNQRLETLMFGTIRPDAPTNEGIPIQIGGTGEFTYEVLPQPIDASNIMIVISNAEAGFSDYMSYFRETTNDGPARIVDGERIYYKGGCAFKQSL